MENPPPPPPPPSSSSLLTGKTFIRNELEEQQINSVTKNKASSSLSSIIDAAAMATKQSSSLLGTKSIGIDYGLVRTGLAITIGYQPSPLPSQINQTNEELANHVLSLYTMERASRIIVGWPLHKNGTTSTHCDAVLQFTNTLAEMSLIQFGFVCSIYLWDERYTSKEAAARARVIDPSLTFQDLYGTMDSDAACILLEHYYTLTEKDGGNGRMVKGPKEGSFEYEQCLQEYQQRQCLKEKQQKEQTLLYSGDEVRKEMIQRFQKQMQQQQQEEEEETGTQSQKKKKKKKKKTKKKK